MKRLFCLIMITVVSAFVLAERLSAADLTPVFPWNFYGEKNIIVGIWDNDSIGYEKLSNNASTSQKKYALKGSGTANDPYQIGSADDLEKFRDMVNGGEKDICAKLTQDIDMKGRQWLPIGRYKCDRSMKLKFIGTFDGDGYVIRNLHGDSDADEDMGLIGYAGSGCVVRNLVMENVWLRCHLHSAPIIGNIRGHYSTVENCGVIGDVTLNFYQKSGANLGGIVCSTSKYNVVRNSYSPREKYPCGFLKSDSKVENCIMYKDVMEGAATGELCYKLNGSTNVSPIWYQTIGKDSYPVPTSRSSVVNKTGVVFHNGELSFKGSGTTDDPFRIATDKQLKQFCQFVNQGYTSICGRLEADIDYSSYKSTSDMIGTETNSYAGTFDGNGKSIKIAFSTNEEATGLFRYTGNATIRNLRLAGSITGPRMMGTLVGIAKGSTTISYIVNTVTMTSTSSDATAGNLVGVVDGKQNLNVSYCGFTGRMLGKSSSRAAGFVGYMRTGSSVTLTSCYFAPEEITIGTTDSYTFVRRSANGDATINIGENCFYTRPFGKEEGNKIEAESMVSGELCFLLNDSKNENPTWLQTIGADSHPTLWNSKRVYRLGNGTFTNDMCPLPGSGTKADPLLVGSAIDLETFRDFVNSGHPDVCARLTADIDMKDRNWIPVGRCTQDNSCQVYYSGTFDGDGFVIRNLSGKSTVDHDMGLIGRATDECVVRNLIMEDVTLEGMHRCAPFIGFSSYSPAIENCASIGLLSFTGTVNKNYGGLIGWGSIDNVRNCYTVYSRLNSSISSATNCYCGDDVKKWAATGELCYKVNGGTGASHHWLQKLGTDPYPMQRSGQKVGKNGNTYYNIEFNDGDNTTYSRDFSSNDFKVIHHGGSLYEFVITLGTKDGQGEHPYPNMDISYKQEESWVTIANLKNINRDKVPFSQDWSGDITDLKGMFINAHTFQKQTPVFWITQGNHTTSKSASLLWMAPDGLDELRMFKVESVGQTTSSIVTAIPQQSAAPTGANAVVVTEPYMDASSSMPGAVSVVLTTANPAYSLGVWDATDNRFISTQEVSDGAQNVTVTMPQQDRVHDIVALMYARQTDMDGSETDTTFVTYGVPFSVKPLHAIRNTNVSSNYNSSNVIKWSVAFPSDNDIMSEDYFVVSRAKCEDYSDATTVESIRLGNHSSTTTLNDTIFGLYSYTDKSIEGQSTSIATDDIASAFDQWNLTDGARKVLTQCKYPSRYIYYKVERASASGIWSSSEKYTAKWKVLLTNVLPKVDTVKVNKTSTWNDDHKVSLRLTLNNPYPYQLVPAAEQNAVMRECERQGFDGRMFAWDEKAKIIVTRYSPKDEWYDGVDEVAETIVVNGSDVKWDDKNGVWYVDVLDIQTAPRTHYYYKAQVDGSESDYPICLNMKEPAVSSDEDAKACYSDYFGRMSDFSASLGEYVGKTELRWTADKTANTSFWITKKTYRYGYKDSSDTGTPTYVTIDGDNQATDYQSKAGQVDEYTLTRTLSIRGKSYSDSLTTYGHSIYRAGRISGHVRMPNGTAFPGEVKVMIRLTSPTELHLNDIKDSDGKLLMSGYSCDSTAIVVPTDADGCFTVDSLCYYGDGIQYTITAQCSGATFLSSTGTGSVTLTMSDGQHIYSDIDFVCNDTHQFSGRILYAGSTVPVRDMEFYVNDYKLMNTSGEAVVTDAMGNFSFTVPKFEVSIQAKKAGHKLSGEGYILGGPGKDQKRFIPTEDYDGLTLTDSTTIRLVGRVAGGDIEAEKEIAFGKSKNILGDSITLVLQLEGDNTSYLYFNRKNPEEKSKEMTFSQTVNSENASQQIDTTKVSFQSKRIVVKADNKTGEFCLDLIPTKYKVSLVYATGYSSLYSAGEGIQVVDLTDSTSNAAHVSEDGSLKTYYAASYIKTYHAPVKVVLKQVYNSNELDYYGENVKKVNLVTGVKDVNTAWIEDGKAKYSFGHPVFKGGTEYTFRVRATEEYRYNNSKTGSIVSVAVGNRPLTVTNGFCTGSPTLKSSLNDSGMMDFVLTPSNTTFSFTDENALMTLCASVEIDGRHYEAEPIRAFVTGTRSMGVDIQAAVESKPVILDYIRDPYGANSYAYREKGTQYNWSQHYESVKKGYFEFNLTLGVAFLTTWGLAVTTGTDFFVDGPSLSMNFVTENSITQKDGEYKLTLNDRIATSSSPNDVGAMADLYIGSVSTVDIIKTQDFDIIDADTYENLKEAVNSGAIKVVSQGTDRNCKSVYLVIAEGRAAAPGTERVFVYSQKHILGTLIPDLERARDKVSIAGNTDSVDMYNQRIKDWQDLIMENEKSKYKALTAVDNVERLSISGATIEHKEESSWYYRSVQLSGPRPYTWSLTGGGSNQKDKKQGDENQAGQAGDDDAGDPGETKVRPDDGASQNGHRQSRVKAGDSGFKGAGFKFSFSLGGGQSGSVSNEVRNYITTIGGSGYSLSTVDNSYIDMDVVCAVDTNIQAVDDEFRLAMNTYENGGELDGNKYKGDSLRTVLTMDSVGCHNYIFIQRGGASRNPWNDADSSFFYTVDGKRVPLGVRTMRIDNPKIYVENPVVNNQPQDEAAVFTIRLANETEINEKTQYLNPTTLYLSVDETSNPDGAKLSIDGYPLRNGMQFYLDPGQSVTKTLEVRRGGKPLDYNNIKLQFSDNPDLWSVVDEATISVHYVPNSTPVNLSMPADNWLMNTLSQVDKDGRYFIPVQIDGFSTTQYDNFDHIELQYKKQTESEDQWVNLCSYYADETLYRKATGQKAMIEDPTKIANIRFYGEKDPIEMKYDLRAVSFCRLGNGYVTRMSEVVSGTKDTRCPEVFGKPKPADGILDFDDVISLPFSEGIAYNYLDETVNFSVQGFTNNSDADHSSYLYFPGTDGQKATSKVERSCNTHNFTVEMMVKVEGSGSNGDRASFFSLVDSASTDVQADFGYIPDEDCLYAAIGDELFKSVRLSDEGLNLSGAMTHVAYTYNAADSLLKFYVVEQMVAMQEESRGRKTGCKASGVISLGRNFRGQMTDVRIWGKELSQYEIGSKYRKILTPKEKGLVGYWPMTETNGNVLSDNAFGADIYLTDVSWQTPKGYSLRLDGSPVVIPQAQSLKFARTDREDFTLAFWFRMDETGDAGRKVMLFSAGGDELREKGMDKMRIGFEEGNMVFRSEGQAYGFGTTVSSLAASVWHHVAVAVNHSQNIASLFIDGEMVNMFSADSIGGVSSGYIAFGDGSFRGNIDNVTMWGMALPSSYIHNNYNTAFTGREAELKVNMNFEQDLMNSQGSMYVAFSPYNNVIVPATGKIADDVMVDESKVTPDQNVHAPVRTGAGIQNLPFSWKSTDDELQININKAEADINNQQINIVVRNVEDLNGNVMRNPQMWTVYVNRNVIDWQTGNVSLEMPYGTQTVREVGFSNKSGRRISYSIDNNSSWLSLSSTKGTLEPLSSGSVTLEVKDGLAPGNYSTKVYLTDEDGLVSSLDVYVVVTADFTLPQVTDDEAYSSSMNIIAKVSKQGASGSWSIDMSPKDVVAAFIDKVCVGRSNLTIDAAGNTSKLYMTILGNTSLSNEPIEFRLYSLSDGQIYNLETGYMIDNTWKKAPQSYNNGKMVGGDVPLEMRTSALKVQNVALGKGWNWVSFNVRPLVSNGLNDLFLDNDAFTVGDEVTRMGHAPSMFQSNGTWDGAFDDVLLVKDNVYQIYMHESNNVTVKGRAIDDSERTVTLKFNMSEWAEMAYLLDVSQPINIALSDFVPCTDKAPAGTIIKSHDQFAVAQKNGKWEGSLQYLRPGEGYYVKRNGLRDEVKVNFTNTTISSVRERRDFAEAEGMDASEFASSMPVIATFGEGQYREGDVLLAVCGDRIVGYAEASGDGRLFFLNVNAQDGSAIRFANLRGGTLVGITSKSVRYDATGVLGSLESPFVVDFTETSAESIYDLTGIKYGDVESLNARRGVFIIDGKKVVK